jgi:hypothetical protein
LFSVKHCSEIAATVWEETMKLVGLLIVPFALFLAGCTPDQASRTPVATAQPAGQAAAASTGQGNARFVGSWTGFWDGGSATRLVVTEVTPQGEAVGNYTFAQNAPTNFIAKIEGDAFRFGSPAIFTFRMQPDGRIRAERLWQGMVNVALLTRS